MANDRRQDTRRRVERFSAKGGSLVYLHKPVLVKLIKPQLIKLGPIIDIGMGGLSVQFIESENKPVDECREISIMMADEGIKVEHIPFKTVNEYVVTEMPGNRVVKNRCLAFGKLSLEQQKRLKEFIEAYSLAVIRDRRSGRDRRNLPDPRYTDPDFASSHERRSGPDTPEEKT